jgi:hypothetical protein
VYATKAIVLQKIPHEEKHVIAYISTSIGIVFSFEGQHRGTSIHVTLLCLSRLPIIQAMSTAFLKLNGQFKIVLHLLPSPKASGVDVAFCPFLLAFHANQRAIATF